MINDSPLINNGYVVIKCHLFVLPNYNKMTILDLSQNIAHACPPIFVIVIWYPFILYLVSEKISDLYLHMVFLNTHKHNMDYEKEELLTHEILP